MRLGRCFVCVLVLVPGVAFSAATLGSCESKARSLTASQKVSLVREWDEDNSEEGDDYVCFFKFTLSSYSSYSIWTDPDADVSLDVYTNNDDAFAEFECDTATDGTRYGRLGRSDWDEDDPDRVVYYVELRSKTNPGQSVALYAKDTYRSFEPVGSEDNRRNLAFSTSKKTERLGFLGGGYWMSASLLKNRIYRLYTTGGTEEQPIQFYLDEFVVSKQGDDETIVEYDDPIPMTDTNNASVLFSPVSAGTCYFFVQGGTNANFSMTYQLLPARTASAHNPQELSAANSFTATFVPGREIASWEFGDTIIDEQLFSIKLGKDERWAFETKGAAVPLKMVLYGPDGASLYENTSFDGMSYDVRVAYKAPTAGTYYVGVCQSDLKPYDEVTGGSVTLTAKKVPARNGVPDAWDAKDDANSGASGLVVMPANRTSVPAEVDVDGHGWHALGVTDWADTFVIAARKDLTYVLSVSLEDPSWNGNTLRASVYTVDGSTTRTISTLGNINPGSAKPLTFTATTNAAYYVRLSVAEGQGLDYPNYKVHAIAYSASGSGLGILTVNTPGAPSAQWSVGAETVKYPSGSSILIGGKPTVKLWPISGYRATVATTNVSVRAGTAPTVVSVMYSDTFDTTDDTADGATALTIKNVSTVYAKRTLWANDPVDYFSFAGRDGCYYDFSLKDVEGDDVVFSIVNAEKGTMAKDVTSVSQLILPKTASQYYLSVKNGADATKFGGYSLSGKLANVGNIKFAKTALAVKEDAPSVVLTVNRTAKDGSVRVKYGTVAGTAKPGTDYIAQNGVLSWANGDNKAKTITIKLMPDLVPVYEGNKMFSVQLKAIPAEERSSSEYPASIIGGNTCKITLTETSRVGTKVADAYAKKAPKLATVKTEAVPLETGTYYGVLAEDGSALTNGMPQLASVTFTASTANPAALSAKVALAGKTYSFSAKGWDADAEAGSRKKQFFLAQKVNWLNEDTGKTVPIMVTNTLTVTVASGATATSGGWLKAGGTAELVMNVPDANKKGYQEEICYCGDLYRKNVKIQRFLTAVTNFTGYYTVALVPEDATVSDGIPAGNGYLTLTVNNKGGVKVAGMLADGAIKPSVSVAACALKEDDTSANGYSMYIPVFLAKSPAVFGGTLRLYADADGVVVVDSSQPLIWNNDDARRTYSGEEGYRIVLDPAGGWYDTVINLQAYYKNYRFEVDTANISEFPTAALASGYRFVNTVQPHGKTVSLLGNVFSTEKKALVKSGKLNKFPDSVNPCNVQLKLARATGLVTGSFSLWSVNTGGTAQKEIAGVKHSGVLILARDAFSPLPDDVVSAGFCWKALKLGSKATRNWTFSAPFNLIGNDPGDIDWWADDWGAGP